MKRSESKRATLWWPMIKLVSCGALIAAIAFVFTVVSSSGSVSESHADISWLSPFERSNTDRFNAALATVGHGSAERYDLNGNTVYFSTHTSRKSPRQVMAEYQEEFKAQGLNDRIYLDLIPDEFQARTQTALTGGLVPLALGDDHAALGGVVTKNAAGDTGELIENYGDANNKSELFRGHRYIEISRPPQSRHTSIVASWSDEAFDHARMIPGSDAPGKGYDATVPACPGCTRLSRFADDNPRRQSQVEMSFIGPRTIEFTRRFYVRALTGDGWQREARDQPLHEIGKWFAIPISAGQTDLFRRDGKELTITYLVDRNSGQTLTLTSLSGP